MAYEKECDEALKFMGSGDRYYDGTNYESVELGMPPWNGDTLDDLEEFQNKAKDYRLMKHSVFAILRAEGLIEFGSKDRMDFTRYFLTDKGKAFLATDTFVARAERWDLENELKKRELTKLRWEVRKMRPTYIIAVMGLVIAALSFLTGLDLIQIAEWLQSLVPKQ